MIRARIFTLLLAAIPLATSAEVVVRGNDILVDHVLEASLENQPAESKPDPAGDDLALFNNGDLMHGTFGGIDDGLIWERKDIARPIKFGLPSIKQIVFNSTRRLELDKKTSFITLVSGDRIPGEILSLNDTALSLKSPVIGDLTLPRNLIRSIAPNPFQGELYYIGPYSSDGWLTLEDSETEEQKEEAEEKEDKIKPSSWIHSGTAFYSQSTSPLILADANLPDVGRISFNVAWKGRLSIALALHSDLTRVIPAAVEEDDDEKEEEVEDEEEEEEALPLPLSQEKVLDLRKGQGFQSIPWIDSDQLSHSSLFGTGYTLSLQSGYPTLTRNFFSNTGTPQQERLNTTRSNSSLAESGEAEIEIRFNRKKALIMLYVDGVYSNQWNDLAGYLGAGTSLGFMNRSSSSKIRISELVISSWGGSTDSARSTEHPDRDIVLLTNGTDRFSGKLSHISKGLAHLETGYSKIQIPLKELSLINLNQSALLNLEDEENAKRLEEMAEAVTIIYQPYGLIKLIPQSASPQTLTGHSPFLGQLKIELAPAVLLRFNDDLPDLSDWFDDF